MTKKEENMSTEPKIFVIYLGVKEIDDKFISQYCTKVSEKIIPKTVEGEFIVIPLRDTMDTRIECINPRYVTDKELIAEHTKLLQKLQADLLKEEAAMNKSKISPKINIQIKEESPVEKLKSALKKPIEMKFEEGNKNPIEKSFSVTENKSFTITEGKERGNRKTIKTPKPDIIPAPQKPISQIIKEGENPIKVDPSKVIKKPPIMIKENSDKPKNKK